METKIYFPLGTLLNDVTVPNFVEVLDSKIPSYYYAQIVLEERFSPTVRSALMSQYSFILDVSPFPDFH